MNDTPAGQGLLVVLAGPSGVGKGTVLRRVLRDVPDAEIATSATTRTPREGELDGVHYHFLHADDFATRVEEGQFLEWAEFAGNRYGTLRAVVHDRVAAGAVVVLEIEVQGAQQVRAAEPEALLVFLAPPSFDELERRLRARGTESEDQLRSRLAAARWELDNTAIFDHVVVNDDVERAATEVIALITGRRRADDPSHPSDVG